MADFQTYKVTALPAAGSRTAHSVYYVAPPANPEYLEIYVTGADATTIKRMPTNADIDAMIASALSNVARPLTLDRYSDLPDPHGGHPIGTIAYVFDASGDPTVNSGAALYILADGEPNEWFKISEYESLDLNVATEWGNIGGRPTSTPAQIDAAVSQAAQALANTHSHANKTQLDKIDEDGSGNLTYGGEPVKTAWSSVAW